MLQYLVILFIILLILEHFLFKYLNANKDDLFQDKATQKRIQHNIDHEAEIVQFFKDSMTERLNMLKHMDFYDWTEYNNTNCIVELNGFKYYIFIYERTGVDEKFILRSTYQQELVNYNYQIERDFVIHKYNVLQLFPPYEHMPEVMYGMNLDTDGFSKVSYNWENPFIKRPEKKNTIFTKFHKDNFDGIIGIGYTKEDLGVMYGNIYYNFLDNLNFIFLHACILLIPVIILIIGNYTKPTFYTSVIILFLSWVFLIWQESLTTTISNLEIETTKMQEISQSVLGISFLVAVNIFIIETLSGKKFKTNGKSLLKKELVFLFCVSVLFLLLSLVKINNYKDVEELRSLRIRAQLCFNYSIFYNFIICFLFAFVSFNNNMY